jgi:hypothetical protein
VKVRSRAIKDRDEARKICHWVRHIVTLIDWSHLLQMLVLISEGFVVFIGVS